MQERCIKQATTLACVAGFFWGLALHQDLLSSVLWGVGAGVIAGLLTGLWIRVGLSSGRLSFREVGFANSTITISLQGLLALLAAVLGLIVWLIRLGAKI